MITDPLLTIAVIIMSAVICQVVAARLSVPSVMFLLAAGVALSSVLDPDQVFGELLFTGIGLGVALLLFEGGTSLNWSRLQTGKVPVIRLVTIGALVAWVIGSVAVAAATDIDVELAILLGAIFIVSGPTVIIPLLRVVRPRQPTASILRWEGILIDPVGAAMAIVVLDAIIEDRSLGRIVLRIVTTFAAGAVVGVAASLLVMVAFRARLVADHLHIPVTLALLVGSYAVANALRPEAGLIAATVLGMAFANQRRIPAAHIAEFNEHLGAIVLGVLFIVLGARVDLAAIGDNLGASLVIIAVLVLVARPATVIASTVGTDITWSQRGFLMALAPRGVVAAAVASLFALELEHAEIDPGPIVPITFTVVVGTVLLAGLGARFAAERFRVAQPDPNGVALIGGGQFALDLADVFHRHGIATIHVGLDAAAAEVAAARGHLVYQGRLDTEEFPDTIKAVGIKTALALSGTDHLDAYATERIARVVGAANLYGVHNPESEAEAGTAQTISITPILPAELNADTLGRLREVGYQLSTTPGSRPRPHWLTIARIDDNDDLVFDPDPTNADPTDILVQFGPAGLGSPTVERSADPRPEATT